MGSVFDDDLKHLGIGKAKMRKSRYSHIDGDEFWDYPKAKKRLPSCWESHPEVNLGPGTFIGGSCHNAKYRTDVAMYIGLCSSPQVPPYVDGVTPPIALFVPIINMKAPANFEVFDSAMDMAVDLLSDGKTIHVGCIGGHGRTGLVLVALMVKMGVAPDEDVISYARSVYCHKAVESREQVDFLMKHYGVSRPPYGSKFKP